MFVWRLLKAPSAHLGSETTFGGKNIASENRVAVDSGLFIFVLCNHVVC
jgi:hypothetical protein